MFHNTATVSERYMIKRDKDTIDRYSMYNKRGRTQRENVK